MKKMRIVSFLTICICSVLFVGCNKKEETEVVAVAATETEEENMFGLTESEQKMYAEYAAGVLMKYNAGSNMRVLEGQTLINQEEKEQAAKEQAERREQLAAEYEANKKNDSSKNDGQSSGDSSSGGDSVSYISDMSAATGTDAFSINYEGYEITDSYPSSGDDLFMAMDATTGKVLLVTKFRVTNISGQTENLNMYSKQGKFRLSLNGEHYKSQYTLLLDDLSMYKGDIDAGEAIDTVLIFEIPETAASNVNDMVLSITVDGEVSSMQLQGGSGMVSTDINVEENAEQETDTEQETDAEQEIMEEVQEGETSEDTDESLESSEYNDLAEEYLNAIEAENAGLSYDGNSSEVSNDTGGNVTVVGSGQN